MPKFLHCACTHKIRAHHQSHHNPNRHLHALLLHNRNSPPPTAPTFMRATNNYHPSINQHANRLLADHHLPTASKTEPSTSAFICKSTRPSPSRPSRHHLACKHFPRTHKTEHLVSTADQLDYHQSKSKHRASART